MREYLQIYLSFGITTICTGYCASVGAWGGVAIYGLLSLLGIAGMHTLWMRDYVKKEKKQ